MPKVDVALRPFHAEVPRADAVTTETGLPSVALLEAALKQQGYCQLVRWAVVAATPDTLTVEGAYCVAV